MGMFGIGGMELGVIAAIALLIFGPSQLPKLARSFGETIKGVKAAGKELRAAGEELEEEIRK